MIENDGQDKPKSVKAVAGILGLTVVLVAGATIGVGWSVIDSIQKKDSLQVELAKKSLEIQTVSDQLSTAGMIKESCQTPLQGSEILYSKAFAATDQGHYAEAEKYLTQVLALIPAEAKTKQFWQAEGCIAYKGYYTSLTYQDRAYCYLKEGKYPLALADLNASIKLNPMARSSYDHRAKVYYLLGDKAHGDADLKMVWTLKQNHRLAPATLKTLPLPKTLDF